ncbi:HD domain-containing protein [Methanosarcina horonobensis]|uniref:hypothetical protein n=1 Tax=Methanosarcina horonobensis TaxID=418008 RepID=UPI000A432648|nr:hypothetical protein [Methanosarcina horonobensis]
MTTRAEAIKLLEESGCTPNVIEHCKEVASLAVEIAEKNKSSRTGCGSGACRSRGSFA